MQPVCREELVFRAYEHGSRDDRKGYILRSEVLGLRPCTDDSVLDFVLSSHEEERDQIKLGAFLRDGMAGTLCMVPREDGTALIRQFAVSTKLQGMGIGRALLNYAHAVARERGFRRIWLDARENAVGFYAGAGYLPTGEREFYPGLTLEKMYIDL